MLINSLADLKAALRSGPYAWPGGYPTYFIMADCEALSFEAAKGNFRELVAAFLRPSPHDGWRVVGFGVNWEDADLYCSHTGKRIESAYAEPEGEA